jgi:hypothetical protein
MSELIGKSVAWLVLAAVLISALNAAVRKAFNTCSNAYLEIQWYLFAAVFLLATGYRFLPGRWRQWCLAALAGLGLGIGASLLLVDGLHLILPTGLQLWRVHWLAHWFAIATLAALLFRHVQERDAGRALILMLAAQLAWGETAFGVVWMVLLYMVWPRLIAPPRERLRDGHRESVAVIAVIHG